MQNEDKPDKKVDPILNSVSIQKCIDAVVALNKGTDEPYRSAFEQMIFSSAVIAYKAQVPEELFLNVAKEALHVIMEAYENENKETGKEKYDA